VTGTDAALIGIDWGTTRLRAFRIDRNGRVLERRDSDHGVIHIQQGGFESAFRSAIDGWPVDLPILMCGMVGSRQGWLEMPYCPCPVQAVDLSRALGTIATDRGFVRILGGVSATVDGRHDVMRGEETQIFGVIQPSGSQLVVAPGTHSKWAIVQDAAIVGFRTYMTGELYAMLREHSILGRLMKGEAAAPLEENSFMDGVRTAYEDQDLLHSLFNVRTEALFDKKRPEQLASYLSGILIGSEVSGAVRRHSVDSAVIISSRELGNLYQMALSAAGLRNISNVDGDHAAAQGLWRLWQLQGAH
jgi:2-dehydro-3-deoxygalactonokinase